ncbi:MAG: sigma-54 interaction domain-containing protein [Clostridiaceae bacterium]
MGSNQINIKTDNSWAFIELDENDKISDFNEKAIEYYPNIMIKKHIMDVLPWFSTRWLKDAVKKRVVKTNLDDRILLQFIQKDESCKKILLNDIFEYKDVMQSWCEIGETLIKFQPFIDCCDDAILVTNGKGIMRAFNNSFLKVSGLEDVPLVNRSIFELESEGLFPHCAVMDVIATGEAHHSLVKFSNGNDTIMSAIPLYNDGKIVRITTNIRNVKELNRLYGELSEDRYINKNHYIKKMKLNSAIERLKLGAYISPQMDNVYKTIENVADFDLPLLITGETGTGKTTIAKCIYLSRANEQGNFVHINCSAIPEALIESELFGYEKGSFTGAERNKKGLFDEASNGIVLLDEIGDMPLQLQSKLLNVIQEKKFYRVGGTKPIETNARIIAATNQDLEKLVENGLFREDLFFRLNVIPINIPALRERKEDIPMLVIQMLNDVNSRYGFSKIISKDAIDTFKECDWPGNIRELKNVIERVILLSKNDIIQKKDLPKETFRTSRKKDLKEAFDGDYSENIFEAGQGLKDIVAEFENNIIDKAIEKYGSVRKAAAELGVNESTITRKRKK